MEPLSLHLTFGKPEYGWLPVTVCAGDFHLTFEAADAPANPIEQLAATLPELENGTPAEVWWFLEPALYRFTFSGEGILYRFSIDFYKDDQAPAAPVFEMTGSFGHLIPPVLQAVQAFPDQAFGGEHWPEIDGSAKQRLAVWARNKPSQSFGEPENP